jgi:hypothetical protein
VEVGVFRDCVPGQKPGEPLLVKKVRITQPGTVADLVGPKEPKRRGSIRTTRDRTPEDDVMAVVRR